MIKKSIFTYIFISLLFMGINFLPFEIYAQDKVQAEAVSLPKVLSFFESKSDIKFSYNAAFIDLLEVDFEYKNLSLEQFLLNIKKSELPIAIEKASGNFYLIRKKEKKYSVEVYEANTENKIQGLLVNVAINGKPVERVFEKDNDNLIFLYTINPDDSIQINSYGFHALIFQASELLKGKILKLALKPSPVILEEVIIENYLSEGVHANIDDHSLEIDMGNLALLPGETDGDILESIKTLPGINSPDSRAGNLYIRGSATDQSLVLYDNIPIYHKGHYFGSISPYNPKVIGSIDVFRNGFQPKLGGRVGGAVDIRSTNDILAESKIGVSANSLNAMAYFIKPIVKNKLGLIVGARKAFPRSLNSPKLEAISDLVFLTTHINRTEKPFVELVKFEVDYSDITAKLLYQINSKNKMSLSMIHAHNNLQHLADDTQDNVYDREDSKLDNLGVNFNWKSQFSDRIFSDFNVTLSDYTFEYKTNSTDYNTNLLEESRTLTNNLSDFSIKYILNIQLNKFDNLNTGIEWNSQQTNFSGRDFNTKGTDNQTVNNFFSQESNGYILSPFINYELRRFANLNIQLGLRTSFFNKENDPKLLPRVFANYSLKNNLKLKASYGRYNQFVSKINNLQLFDNGGLDNELLMLSNEKNVKVMTGKQYMIGGLLNRGKWLFDLELYQKETRDITNVPNSNFDEEGNYVYGILQSKGLDLLLKYNFNKNLTAWASYTYSESLIEYDTLPGVQYFTRYDQPHILKMAGVFKVNRWKVSLGWKLMSGLYAQFPGTVGTLENPNNVGGGDPGGGPGGGGPGGGPGGGGSGSGPGGGEILEEGQSYSPYDKERYPTMHIMDLSVVYILNQKENPKWRGSVGLSIQNLYNKKNIVGQSRTVNPNGSTIYSDIHALAFAPNIKILFEW